MNGRRRDGLASQLGQSFRFRVRAVKQNIGEETGTGVVSWSVESRSDPSTSRNDPRPLCFLVGPAIAERIIAKLRRKMPKFVLLVGRDESGATQVERSVMDETFQILCSLGHSESDARRLLDGVLATKQKFKDVEALLQAVYQHRNT